MTACSLTPSSILPRSQYRVITDYYHECISELLRRRRGDVNIHAILARIVVSQHPHGPLNIIFVQFADMLLLLSEMALLLAWCNLTLPQLPTGCTKLERQENTRGECLKSGGPMATTAAAAARPGWPPGKTRAQNPDMVWPRLKRHRQG